MAAAEEPRLWPSLLLHSARSRTEQSKTAAAADTTWLSFRTTHQIVSEAERETDKQNHRLSAPSQD